MRNLRNISIITIIALSILLFIFQPYPFSRLPFFPISAVEAIPVNAGLVIEFKNLEQFRNDLDSVEYKRELNKQLLFRTLNQDLQFLEKLVAKDSLKKQVLLKSPLLVNLQSSGSEELHFLLVLELPSNQLANGFTQFLCKHKDVKLKSSVFKNQTVYELKGGEGESLSVSPFRNLLLLGKYSLLVEDGLEQLKSMKKHALSKVTSTVKGTSRIYCKPSGLTVLALPFINAVGKKQIELYKESDLWLGGDVYFEKEGLRLEGQIKTFGNGLLQKIVKGKPADRSPIIKVLPNNLAIMSWLGFDSVSSYTESNALKANAIFNNYFAPWLGDHLAYVITEPYSTKLDAERFLVLSVKDIDLAEDNLQRLAEQEGELKLHNYMTYRIRQIMTDDLLESGIWNGASFKNPYITIIENYMILAQSRQALEVWIDKYLSGQILSKDAAFLDYSRRLGEKTNYWHHVQLSNSKHFLRSLLQKKNHQSLENELLAMANFYPIGFEINKGGKVKGLLEYHSEKATADTRSLWKTALDDEVIGAPTVITNPQTQQKEVWVQDKSNVLQVLNNEGDLLWHRKLDAPLLSDIFVLDFYENDDVHFLFNTPGKIYIVNNKGQDVGSFPIRLQSKATNGVLAVDFDDNGKYQFFVACRNGNVYGFERIGRPVPGWNPLTGEGRVDFPIKHFQKGGKDFVMITKSDYKMNVYDRNGKERFKPIRFKDKIRSAPDFDTHSPGARMVALNRKGLLEVINLEGKTFGIELNMGDINDAHLAFGDIANDGRKDYIALSKNNMKAFAYDENSFVTLFEKNLKDKPDELFTVKLPNKKKSYIGTLTKNKKRINLYNGSGKKIKGFPLAGSTPFEVVRLFGDREDVLVVGNGKSVVAYRL